MTDTATNPWWAKERANNARLTRALRRLLVDLGSGDDTTESQREAWAALKDIESPDKLYDPPDHCEFPRIIVGKNGERLDRYIQKKILEPYAYDGLLESVEGCSKSTVGAFANLIEVLMNRGILDGRDLKRILDGHYDAKDTPHLYRENGTQ